ncbi:MAG: hypothetical protein K2K73_02005 [Ureaplasma sp.]|nr:hypothetical protein [Ureaplasma sp.]
MRKLKLSADGYIIGTVIFWFVFIGMVIVNTILISALNLNDKNFAGLSLSNFIGVMLLLGLFVGLVIMMNFAWMLLVSSKYASSANYKAEAKWAISVFALNWVFTICFLGWFIVNVLMVVTPDGHPTTSDAVGALAPVLNNKALVTEKYFTLYIKNILDYCAIVGLVSGIVAFSLSITISNRANNVVRKIKDYEKVNIY